MGDDTGPFVRKVMVNVGNNLNRNVGFTGSRRSDNHGQTGLHTGSNSLNLRGRKWDRVSFRFRVGVRASVCLGIRFNRDRHSFFIISWISRREGQFIWGVQALMSLVFLFLKQKINIPTVHPLI